MRYLVEYRETFMGHAYVEADTPEEAEAKFLSNDGVESTQTDEQDINVYEVTEVSNE